MTLRVAILSDEEVNGGAAIAACRLAQALCRAGHEVVRVVRVGDGHEHPWQTRLLGGDLLRKAAPRLLPLAASDWLLRSELRKALVELAPDVINVHNLHGGVAAGWSADLAGVAADCGPTVWTLHDMWSFTGRCAYSYDCQQFLTGCDATCPTPNEYPALAPGRIAAAWRSRRQLLGRSTRYPFWGVTPSRWLAAEARAGLWTRRPVEVIPYGLPLDVFLPLDRRLAREALGIEARGPVLLTCASDHRDRRKGATFLKAALEVVARRPLTLVTLGACAVRLGLPDVFEYSLGYVDHERTKVLAYAAADLLVHAAPVDNLPNAVMEAIACGTPVVGFPIGGVHEMVRPGVTGWLARDVSARALAAAIEEALGDIGRGTARRESCRAVATAEYGDDLQAMRYTDLFSRLRAGQQPGRAESCDAPVNRRVAGSNPA